MASPNTFDIPDPKQTLKKLPYDRAAPQHCGWAPVVYVPECRCHDCNQKTGRQRLATLKTVLMTSLTLLVVVLIINSARVSSCGESHVSKAVPGFEDEMMSEVEGHRVERDLELGLSPIQTSSERKHRHRKSKGKKKKERSRRSNGGIRAQIREIRRDVQTLRRLVRIPANDGIGVHLTYTPGSEDSLVYGDNFFVWTLMSSSPGFDFFEYSRAPNQDLGLDIYGVKVKFDGQYLVYSQVLVNGRNNINFMPHDCGHETVLTRNNQVQRVLLKSFLTQNDLGLPYGSDSSGNDGDPAVRPKDTSFQMGVFHFHNGDEVRVRIPEICSHFLYSGHEEGSHFGLVRL